MAVRFLLAKIGIDGHDRGARTVALALRDAGMEVIYTGPWQSIESVTETAIQEDVDIIGISTLGGDYFLVPKLLNRIREKGLNIPVIVGGIIPARVEEDLRKAGVAAIFHPGASIDDIIKTIHSLVSQHESGEEVGNARRSKP
ncbi:MAG TPA: methylmalonyl-CoA mutase [Dehalococcoidia bacterium]|nr:methylmalonyl-CoA mutase [Dehalococcoidia bacterium]